MRRLFDRTGVAEKDRRLKALRERLEEKDREIAHLRGALARKDAGDRTVGIDPGNVVWIFGGPRTGSTWLGSMMEEFEGHALWREPLVGELFGHLYYVRAWEGHYKSKHFVLGRHRETWLRSIRSFVLEGADARFPEVAPDGYLVVKEPNGSLGAPLLVEALPESRMILLIRDPRDVVASALDAAREGSWYHERRMKGKDTGKRIGGPSSGGWDDVVAPYVRSMSNARAAYEAHGGRKTLVRYEDLRADALGTMKRIYSELGVPVEEGELGRVVEKHAWENIPEEKRGEGRFYRKAQPGGWREDLTPEQVEAVERVGAPLLREFYPDDAP